MPKQEEMKGSFLQPRGDMGCLSLCLCPVVLIYQSGPRANISKRVPTSVFIRMRRNVTGLALRKPCSSQKPQLCISDRILRLSGLILGTSVTDTETDDGDLWPCYRGAVESQGRGRRVLFIIQWETETQCAQHRTVEGAGRNIRTQGSVPKRKPSLTGP